MASVYALLTIESFSESKVLLTLRANGSYHSQKVPDGSRQAFVYDSQEAGDRALARLRSGQPTLDLEETGTYRFLQRSLEAGIERLVVNFGLEDERTYSKADMHRMIGLIEGAARTSAPLQFPKGAEEPALRLRAKSPPRFPPIPAPGRSEEATVACFTSWRQKLEQRSIEPRQFLEAFAFEMDIHVPVYGEPIDGLAWPRIFPIIGLGCARKPAEVMGSSPTTGLIVSSVVKIVPTITSSRRRTFFKGDFSPVQQLHAGELIQCLTTH